MDWKAFFAERSAPSQATGCIEWTRGLFSNGYGNVWDPSEKRPRKAHRVAYERLVGPIPSGMLVCHRCDNKLCINPAHLFLGTTHDNVRDKIAKGRDPRGDRHGSRTKPWARPRGDANGARKHRDRMPRGDRNGARLHPERLARGEASPKAVLRERDIPVIRSRIADGESDSKIARDYGVNHSTINRIKLRRSWTHVP